MSDQLTCLNNKRVNLSIKPAIAITGYFNLSYLKQVLKTCCQQDTLKKPRTLIDGFLKPVLKKRGFFHPCLYQRVFKTRQYKHG